MISSASASYESKILCLKISFATYFTSSGMTYPLPSINALAFEAKTKLIEALGDAPKEIKSANFDKLNCWGFLVAKTIFKIYRY